MAKKDDVKKEETTAVEASEKKLVSVEMTQEQLDEYAKYAAKKEDEKALLEDKLPEPTKWYDMNLVYEHNINGRKYGPGKTRIPDYHLGMIQNGENISKQQEIRLNQSSKRMYQILENGQAIPVPVTGRL